jgi:o-succinylbenzoate---CoA ligase
MIERDWFTKRTDSGHTKLSDWSNALPDDQFNARTARFASMLAGRFPDKRSRIGLWGSNSLDYVSALISILRAGHVAVPLNTRLTPHELADLSEAADLAGLLAAREFPQTHRAALTSLPTFSINQKIDPVSPIKSGSVRELGDKDVAVLMCSSGTTGRAKIVPLTLRSLLDHAAAVCEHLKVTWHDSWLVCLPFYHVGGLAIVFRCLVSGASLKISQSADSEEINDLIDSGDVSVVSVVPTVLERMLNKRENREYPKSLRAIIVGGGPVPETLLQRCPKAYATYGMTEAGSTITCARPGCSAAERSTLGLPLPGTRIKILNDAGKEVRAGETGQIVVSGPGIARTYLGDSTAAAETFKSGWIFSGDLGFVDDGGFLHVQARRNDVVLSGGENIYPAEIEKALLTHPRVKAAAVVPVEDDTWGQAPGALIVLSEGRPLQRIHIFYYLEERLARHKFPRWIVFAEAIPTLANGKPDLAEVRKIIRAHKEG